MEQKYIEIFKNENINDNLILRKLDEKDINKGFFELLSQLTSAEKPTEEAFKERLDLINRRNVEQIFVIESKAESKIIGTITVFIEMKFIHGINQVGHIEDFVVDKNFRGLKLGKKLMNVAKNYCLENNCYKIILDCEDSLIPLYERFGFKKKANSMQLYYI